MTPDELDAAIKDRWPDMPHKDVARCIQRILERAPGPLTAAVARSSYLAVEATPPTPRLAYVHRGLLRLRTATDDGYEEIPLTHYQTKPTRQRNHTPRSLCSNCFLQLPLDGSACRCEDDL